MGTFRRIVLQQIGLAALGIGGIPRWLSTKADRYGQALAASSRKQALLIGINHYPNPGEGSGLDGSGTDVELQREVLIHRFGFDPASIVILRESQATPEGIHRALQESVGEFSAPDTLVVHWSGYGCLLTPPLDPAQKTDASSEIPALLLWPGETGSSAPLPLPHLLQWIEATQIPNVTTVLDCGFAYGDPAIRGNLRLRSRPDRPWTRSDSAHLGAGTATGLPSPGQGVLFAATTAQELAAEATWSGFSAGVLTYLLTQYLWEITPRIRAYTLFSQVSSRRELGTLSCQHPAIEGEETRVQQSNPYFLPPIDASGLTGVVQEVKGNRAQIWLGGVPPAVLCGLQNGTLLAGSLSQAQDQSVPPLVLRSRNGLYGQAYSIENDGPLPPEGTLVQEQARLLSQSLRLVVGLDDSLGRIEKVDITSALAGLDWTETANPRERQVDCLLGRITPQMAERMRQMDPALTVSEAAYGLFWGGREQVIGSFGATEEAAGSAVQRLSSRMQHLLAAKRLRTTLNSGCSALALTVTLSIPAESGDPLPVLRQQTSVAPEAGSLAFRPVGLAQFTAGQPLRLTLANHSDHDLYLLLLNIDSRGQLSLLSPAANGGPSFPPLQIPANSSLEIPSPDALYRTLPDLLTCQPGGLIEVMVVASTRSLQPSLEVISSIAREIGITQVPLLLNRPLDLVGMVLKDLTHSTADADLRQLNHGETVTLSMTYRVV